VRLRLVLVLVVLLGGAVWALLDRRESSPTPGDAVERHEEDGAAPPLRREAEDAADASGTEAAEDVGPRLAGGGGPGASSAAEAAAPQPVEDVGPDATDDAAALFTGEVPPGWLEAPPAQRPHPIRPPGSRGPSLGGGSEPGGFGPTGHWTRFTPPPPPKGDAAIRVTVLDSTGARVPGADVLLGPRESLGEEAVSFGDLRKLGVTDPRGELLASDLPAGAGVLAGNVANLLNGPRGLDMRSSIPVLLVDHATVRAVVRLPLDLGAYGRIAGRVVDEKGRAVARAEIRCDFFRAYADADGRFRLPQVPEGSRTVTAQHTGYATARESVDVPRGGTATVEIVLAWRESGSLRLEGRVYDATGAALPGATVYLIDEGGRGTLRTTTTDADGRYVFEDLPERLLSAPVRVQADRFRDGYRAANVRLEEGIHDPVLDLRLPPQQVRLRLRLREAGSGEPVTRCRVEVEPLDDAPTARGFLGSNAGGVFEHFFDAGRYRFRVEAPDRETQVVEADLSPPGGEVEVELRFPGGGEASVQVTLRVTVDEEGSGLPVTAVGIVLLDAAGAEAARFDGASPDGTYSLPAPSGHRVLRVSAKGYETHEEPLDLPAEEPEADVTVHLRPR